MQLSQTTKVMPILYKTVWFQILIVRICNPIASCCLIANIKLPQTLDWEARDPFEGYTADTHQVLEEVFQRLEY